MDDLIEALQILRKYGNPEWPTHCEHDVLYVDIDSSSVSLTDRDRLAELGFNEDEDNGGFMSFKFGSC